MNHIDIAGDAAGGRPSIRIVFVDPHPVYLDGNGVKQLTEDEFGTEERRAHRDWDSRGYTVRFFHVEAANATLDVVTKHGADRKHIAAVLACAIDSMWRQWMAMAAVGALQ